MEITASGINFYNLPENSTVQVYTTAGVQVFSATGNGELSVPGEKLTGGINLVRVNGTTYKVSFK
jgi:beta-lactamase superfamily II metal-dependent hydrolase